MKRNIFYALLTFSVSNIAVAAPPIYEIKSNAAPGALVDQLYAPLEVPYGLRTYSFPSLNDFGDVAGRVLPADTQGGRITSNAAMWRDGVLTNLGLLGCESTVSYCGARILSVNYFGVGVGSTHSLKYPSPYTPAPLTPYYEHEAIAINGKLSVVGSNGWEWGWLADINDQGHYAGSGRSNISTGGMAGDYLVHGIIKLNGTYPYEIGTYGQASYANAINNFDQVTGSFDFDKGGHMHAYLWSKDLTMVDLGTLGGNYSEGWDVNSANPVQVVGGSKLANGDQHAFIWRNGVMSDLGTLGGTVSVARSLNNQGVVVGYSSTASGEKHAFIWQAGTMYDLNNYLPANSGWTIFDAYSINKFGEILVRGANGTAEYYIVLSPPGTVHDTRPVLSATPKGVSYVGAELSGGSNTDLATLSQADSNGNTFMAGKFLSSPADLNPGPGEALFYPARDWAGSTSLEGNAFVTKMNADGSYGWSIVAQVPDYFGKVDVQSMATDASGNLYVSIYYRSSQGAIYLILPNGVKKTLYFDYAYGDLKGIILKFDPNGSLVWSDVIETMYGVNVLSMSADANGNLVLAGIYTSANYVVGSYDYRAVKVVSGVDSTQVLGSAISNVYNGNLFVMKLNSNGNYISTQFISPTSTDQTLLWNSSATTNANGDIYVTGQFLGSVDFDPTNGTDVRTSNPSTKWDNFLTKINANGTYAWTTTTLASPSGAVLGVTAEPGGGVYWLRFDWGDKPRVISKVSPSGLYLWTNSIAGQRVVNRNNVAHPTTDAAGNVYFVGVYSSPTNFDTTGGVDYKDTTMGYSYVTRLNQNGSYGWTMVMKPGVNDAAIDRFGFMSLVGDNWQSSFDFDPNDNIPAIPGYGSDDAFRVVFRVAN